MNLPAELSMMDSFAERRGGQPLQFAAANIPREAFEWTGPLGLLPIDSNGPFFEPCENGPMALILPIFESPYWSNECVAGPLIDFVALRPDEPKRFWLRNGTGKILGRWNLDNARKSYSLWPLPGDEPEPPLPVYRSPWSWLRAGCRGICSLHETWTSVLVADVALIEAEDMALAVQLAKQFRRNGPRILVRRSERITA